MDYFKWYTGVALHFELLCADCVKNREKSVPVQAARICEECFERAAYEVGSLDGTRGKPEIIVRPEAITSDLKETQLPADFGTVLDIAPIECDSQSRWLLLSETGELCEFYADTGTWKRLAAITLQCEPDHEPWCGHALRHRLHVSPSGRFAAVVNDFGKSGQVVDLSREKSTIELNCDNYHSDTVPFSFAFLKSGERDLFIHRTAWNRLDISDPLAGKIMTERTIAVENDPKKKRPEHDLNYFHGAIYLSPDGDYIVDDGWVWHPVGVVTRWSVKRWLAENVWESEDGPSIGTLCCRDYYWNAAIVWVDEKRVAVGGIGEDDNEIIDGARIFDVSQTGDRSGKYHSTFVREVQTIAGPHGLFFSDGRYLFSSDEGGLKRWDLNDGAMTGEIAGFKPGVHHRAAKELVQLIHGRMRRLKLD